MSKLLLFLFLFFLGGAAGYFFASRFILPASERETAPAVEVTQPAVTDVKESEQQVEQVPSVTSRQTSEPLPESIVSEQPSETQAITQPAVEDEQAPQSQKIGVYFLDEKKFASGKEPYEVLVGREFDSDKIIEVEVLTEIFRGPTPEERGQGLSAVLSGARTFELWLSKGIAHVYLKGGCSSGGSTYTIANLIFKNLSQFADIKAVKIYDPEGNTARPEGEVDSIPECLEP